MWACSEASVTKGEKNVNLKCRHHWFVCVCVYEFVVICVCMCVLAAIWEAVRTHRDALEVFYHAAVIVACLPVMTLSAILPQVTIL